METKTKGREMVVVVMVVRSSPSCRLLLASYLLPLLLI